MARCLAATVALALALASACAQTTLLQRFNAGATDVLGQRVTDLMKRVDEFRVAVSVPAASGTSNSAGAARAPVYPTVPVATGRERPDSSMIILHGLDSKPEDLVVLTTVARQWLPRTRFVIPRAPVADVSYLKRRAASWFDIFRRTPGREDEAQLRAAAAGVARLVRLEQSRHGIPSDRVIVLGMSQGGAVALTLYLAEEIKLAGVIAAATWLPIPSKWKPQTLAKANANTNLLMIHGDKDPVIPIKEAIQSMERVRALGRNVKWIRYARGGHTLSEEPTKLMLDILDFSKKQLNVA